MSHTSSCGTKPIKPKLYLLELSQLVLERNWSHNILETILSSSQGNCIFIDWKIEIENLNAILTQP